MHIERAVLPGQIQQPRAGRARRGEQHVAACLPGQLPRFGPSCPPAAA
jgi:hypothetical protein